MDKMTCPECGAEITNVSEACPSCGCPAEKLQEAKAIAIEEENRRKRLEEEAKKKSEESQAGYKAATEDIPFAVDPSAEVTLNSLAVAISVFGWVVGIGILLVSIIIIGMADIGSVGALYLFLSLILGGSVILVAHIVSASIKVIVNISRSQYNIISKLDKRP